MNNSYLVNIVANDFKDGTSIFEPFDLGKSSTAHANGVTNGIDIPAAGTFVNGIKKVIDGAVLPLPNGH